MKKMLMMCAVGAMAMGLILSLRAEQIGIEYLNPVYVGGVAENGIDYWESRTTTATCVLPSSGDVTWSFDDYAVVNDAVTINGNVTCTGRVRLILGLRTSLTIKGQLFVSASNGNASLEIYGQSKGAGSLTVWHGIHGVNTTKYYSASTTLNGGDLAIRGTYGNVTVNGGIVDSTLFGIVGDGSHKIIINGGEVTASGGIYSGAGIGGYADCASGSVTINGGRINATGGVNGGAGIGGCKGRTASNIRINGGNVTATGGCFGASAIGGGLGGSASNIYASEDLLVKADDCASPWPVVWHTSNTDIAKGLDGKQYATVEPLVKAKVQTMPAAIENTTFQVYTNGVLSVDGSAWTNEMATVVYSTDYGYYFPGGLLSLTNDLDTSIDPAVNDDPPGPPKAFRDTPYLEPVYLGGIVTNGIACWQTNMLSETCAIVTSSATPQTWNAGWYAIMGENIAINGGITCNGAVNLVLCDGAKLTVNGVADDCAGISVSPHDNASLVIYGQPDGAGKLEVTGGKNGAGVGGNAGIAGTCVTINGGTVTAAGGSYGAGIGGGSERGGSYITINGGVVTATAKNGAGMGGGYHEAGHDITINGGVVTATGSSGAGLGGGSGGKGFDIRINDGEVTSSGGTGAGIGGGNGYSGENISVCGGSIWATGSSGAGIGGGNGSGGENITISGGLVTATGSSGAGVGGGRSGAGRYICISGGNVTATGGAGIGGGAVGENITISGGVVVANGVDNGSGIGGGSTGGNGRNIIITGGKVTANGGHQGDCIGRGYNGSSSNVCVTTTMRIRSDNDNPPVTVIDNDGSDLSLKLAGNRYATVEVRPECVITVNAAEYGVVKASAALAEAGETIALTVMPDEGCELVSLAVHKTGEPMVVVDMRKVADNIYSFVMPEYGVSVSPTFRISPPPKPEGGPYKETVDGVEWTFMIDANLNASVGTGVYGGWAIPQLTTGAITIPAKLGGRTVASVANWAFVQCTSLLSVTISSSVTGIGEWAFNRCSGLKELTISEGVQNIGEFAFADCSGLMSVAIPSSVAKISDHAFSDCDSLVDVTIPKGVTNIGEYAFCGCGSLTSVMIPSSVTSIGIEAFGGCTGLVEVTISEGIVSIGSWAFERCTSLTSVTIPSSVTSIGEYAFADCSGLLAINVDAQSGSYSSQDGALMDKNSETLLQCPCGKSGLYNIPSTVTNIGLAAFRSCTGLSSVIIPSSVVNIGEDAFGDCSKLQTVTIPSSVMSIGDHAFASCVGLTSVTLSAGVANIGSYAFQACRSVSCVTIPSSVVSIGNGAFDYCNNLNAVDFEGAPPEGVGDAYIKQDAAIRYNVAYEAQWLPVIEECGWTNATPYELLPEGGPYKETVDGVEWTFMVDANLNASLGTGEYGGWAIPQLTTGAITIPAKLGGRTVASIGDWAFYGCSGLTAVTIPSSVTNIGGDAFYGCSCLKNITIPPGVTSIEHYAFSHCDSLSSVTLSEDLERIGRRAFDWCGELESVTIPKSVKDIGISAFSSCTKLQAIDVHPQNTYYSSNYGVLFDKNKTQLIQCPGGKQGAYEIPSSVTVIADSAFFCCSGLTSVMIPASTTVVGESAFYGCSGMTGLTISDGVKIIEDGAFNGCTSLVGVSIPASVTNIGLFTFSECSGLKGIDVDMGNALYSSQDGVLFDIDKKVLLQCPGGRKGDYAIPSDVTRIGEGAFCECSELTSVVIPEGVTSIGVQAFYGCSGLTSVTIPLSVTDIGEIVFAQCSSLLSIVIPSSVTSIGGGSFGGCGALNNVVISDGVKVIEWGAFDGCIGLTSVIIPPSILSVQNWAFGDCDNLNSVDFEGAPPEEVQWAGFKQDAAIRYNVAYEAQWLPVIEECGWTNATPYVPVFVPVFSPKDGTVFKGSCTVTLTCPTPGASIYYRIGSKPKATSKYLYSVPFEITETSTVYAFAKLGDTESDCVTATYTKGKVITFEEAVKAKGITAFTHGGDAVWGVEEGLGEGDVCVRSGVIIDEQVSWFETTVEGPGTISFKWKASCEEDYPSQEWDHLAFNIDGAKDDYARLDGVTDWEEVSAKLEAGTHTLRWSYVKDESDAEGEDCGWVDCVTWVADAPAPVPPGGEIVVPEGKTAKEFADEVNKNKAQYLNWPLEGPVSTDYLGYFTAVPKGDAKVEFVLNEEGTNQVVEATTAAKTNTLESVLSKSGTLVIGDSLIGFYYSLKQGSDVTVGDKADLNKLAGRDELSFPLTTDKSKYFYQSLVTPTPLPKE